MKNKPTLPPDIQKRLEIELLGTSSLVPCWYNGKLKFVKVWEYDGEKYYEPILGNC